MGLTYRDSGVDYGSLDAFKRAAQAAASRTSLNIRRSAIGTYAVVEASRGDSTFLIETPTSFIAHVEEGLGTKNLIADWMFRKTGKNYYHHIAQDTVAMIVNDMITSGALPISVAMHLAVGDSNWFKNGARTVTLIDGWEHACNVSRTAWGGGETPALKDLVFPKSAVISGSGVGVIDPKENLISEDHIEIGDQIILIESNGIHANGLSIARAIAERKSSFWWNFGMAFAATYLYPADFPPDYLTKLSDGRSFGESLLDPTHIYVPVIEELQHAGIKIKYAVNITGHGWRKLMRPKKPFSYILEQIPTPHPVFEFIQMHGPVDDREAYGNFNMGAGFALYVSKQDVSKVLRIIHELNFNGVCAGYISDGSEGKSVTIVPKKLIYEEHDLQVR